MFRLLIILFSVSPFALAATESRACKQGEHWVRAHHRRAYTRADGAVVAASEISAHCRKNSVGFEYWNPKKKADVPPGWQHPEEKPKAWTEEEWEKVLEALSELPEILWSQTIEGVHRLRKSRYPDNPAAGEPKKIAIYDAGFEPKQNLAQILAHELAHELYRNISEADRESYQHATHWFERKVGDRILVVRGRSEKQFIKDDGVDSPADQQQYRVLSFRPQEVGKGHSQCLQMASGAIR